ncbi:MAG: ankyrin repeat domain-containing protein [Patescibacteria group bacterium]|nr:ankyrin repeat domain-containing protein [Patescibacteria group bacterium]
MHAAVREGDIDLVRALLDMGDKCNHARKLDRSTPLITATYRADVKMVELLLAHKADVNQADIRGKSPLYYQWRSSLNHDIADLLLTAGAYLNEQIIHGLKYNFHESMREMIEKNQKWQRYVSD